MESRDLDLAAEFCTIVGAADLLAYLGIEPNVEPITAQATLRSRRRFMQGMQGNPKYKREALFLIRHFSALHAVLDDIPGYLADTRRRGESAHLPVLEMTIRGVLAAGSLHPDQRAYLARNARELGVSSETFEGVLARAAQDLGVDIGHAGVTSLEPDTLPPPEIEAAEPRLYVHGPEIRPLALRRGPDGFVIATVEVENLGAGPMPGRVTVDAPWVAADPTRLDPEARMQTISVQIDPSDVPRDARTTTLTLTTRSGERATVTFALRRGPSVGTMVAVGLGALLLAAVVGAITLSG